MKHSIKMPYGQGFQNLFFDDAENVSVLKPHFGKNDRKESEVEIVEAALRRPIDAPCLSELSRGKQKIVIITSDHTRPVPSSITMPLILAEIRRGNPEVDITILIATGAHRETTREELEAKFGKSLTDNEKFVIHHADVASENVSMGMMPNGTELRINRVAAEADLLIAEGFIEPHFFAGFSGGRKSVLPGIADMRSVCANHCARWIDHPKARTGVLDGNPMHAEMTEAARSAKLAFILNVVLDEDKKIIAAFAGNPETAHQKGCETVREMFRVSARKADIVVATNGGYPLDQNLYQAVKGMTAAEAACNPDGVIIMMAECGNGHGGETFFGFFDNAHSVDFLYAEILKTPSYDTKIDQWEAQILLRILQKHTVILVSSLPESVVKTFRMQPAASFDEAYASAKNIIDKPRPSVTVIPDGVSVIVENKSK